MRGLNQNWKNYDRRTSKNRSASSLGAPHKPTNGRFYFVLERMELQILPNNFLWGECREEVQPYK